MARLLGGLLGLSVLVNWWVWTSVVEARAHLEHQRSMAQRATSGLEAARAELAELKRAHERLAEQWRSASEKEAAGEACRKRLKWVTRRVPGVEREVEFHDSLERAAAMRPGNVSL
jgi:hypothetical protein